MHIPNIHIDFETRSAVNLKVSGSERYAEDPSTSILCMAYKIDDGEILVWDPLLDPLPKCLTTPYNLIAHNASFELAIIEHKLLWLGAKRPSSVTCTMTAAMQRNLPAALSDVCKALGLPDQKSDTGRKLMLKMCKAGYEHTPEELSDLIAYCVQDVKAECGLHNLISMLESELYALDRKINSRGILADTDLAEGILQVVEWEKSKLTIELQELTEGAVQTGNQVAALLAWLRTQSYPYYDLTADSVSRAIENRPVLLTNKGFRALQIRENYALGSIGKYKSILGSVCSDGRVKGLFQMCGAAQTGRWAGRRVQFQNLPRLVYKDHEIELAVDAFKRHDTGMLKFLFGDVFTAAKQLIRPTFIATERSLIVSDFAAIECRVLAWLVGEEELLSEFRSPTPKVYEKMSAKIYNVPVELVTKPQRQIGKMAVLGCFGAGTKVLTDRGSVNIEDVTIDDWVWDGVEWVSHGGVVDQGVKSVLDLAGVQVTPDHRILTPEGWRESWKLKGTDLFWQATWLASSRLPRSFPDQKEDTFDTSADALVEASVLLTDGISCSVKALGATGVRNSSLQEPQPTLLVMNGLYPTDRCESCGTEDYLLFDHDALTQIPRTTKTTEGEGSDCIRSGRATRDRFCDMSSHSKGGMTPALNWTERITTEGMFRGTCECQLDQKIVQTPEETTTSTTKAGSGPDHNFIGCSPLNTFGPQLSSARSEKDSQPSRLLKGSSYVKVRTYDISNAGPLNRFTIVTNEGPLIVHNCGYGLGANGFYEQLQRQQIEVTFEECQEAITAYRNSFSKTRNFWYRLEDKFKEAILHPGEFSTYDKLTFACFPIGGNRVSVTIRLPSGRKLYFHNCTTRESTFGQQIYFDNAHGVSTPSYGGKLCLGAGTPVLTDRGWVAIEYIQLADRVFDGENWVCHEGVIAQGTQEVIFRWGAWMTPDHRVLTTKGWRHASHLNRYTREEVLVPEGYETEGVQWQPEYSRDEMPTYDILNAGPLRRFVVLGDRPFISHNCENITQAIARDLLANAMLSLDKAGFDIVATVHDEIVLDRCGEEHVAAVNHIMSTPPDWANTLPLAAETHLCNRYSK